MGSVFRNFFSVNGSKLGGDAGRALGIWQVIFRGQYAI